MNAGTFIPRLRKNYIIKSEFIQLSLDAPLDLPGLRRVLGMGAEGEARETWRLRIEGLRTWRGSSACVLERLSWR